MPGLLEIKLRIEKYPQNLSNKEAIGSVKWSDEGRSIYITVAQRVNRKQEVGAVNEINSFNKFDCELAVCIDRLV